MDIDIVLEKTCKDVIVAFNNIIGIKPKHHIFYIDCNQINDRFHKSDIRQSAEFKAIFDTVAEIKTPVVYWFTVANDVTNDDIIEAITKYKKSPGARSTPALKELCFNKSRVLYVGKVKKGFLRRLITHLGFLKGKGQTQGLQLNCWKQDLNLSLELNVLEF